MPSLPERTPVEVDTELRLPISILIRYLFFLSRRPISGSNLHFLHQRLVGLKSLSKYLQGTDIVYLDQAIQQLDAINPANFHRLSERLQFTLLPLTLAADQVPYDLVCSTASPSTSFLNGARRVLLLLGPAIGIGDEIILFPLPTWIKTVNPQAVVTTLSAYSGLWERVKGVDQTLHYREYESLLQALRGEAPYDGFDLVIMADFEKPDLYPAICHEGKLSRYVELSLGAQSLTVLDNRHRWLHRAPRPFPYFANYYYGFDYLLRWLGFSPQVLDRRSAFVRRSSVPPEDHLRIYVNPFTSKYDPSEPYWSQLLSSLFSSPPSRPVRLVLDPGPNSATRHFATALLHSVQPRVPPGVNVELAEREDGKAASFDQVLTQIEQAHILISADSFPSHAAALFDCAAFVISGRGLENWRVPCMSNYYFGDRVPLPEIISSIKQVLTSMGAVVSEEGDLSPISEAEIELDTVTRELDSLLHNPGENKEVDFLYHTFCKFALAYEKVVDRLPQWPPEFSGLLDDISYSKSLPSARDFIQISDNQKPDLLLHMQDRWEMWQNSNLRKYIGLVTGKAADPAFATKARAGQAVVEVV